ncbi:hypothetical protein GE09DRAFT_359817 [Coniochaeta sp. 2T2.1]|nr:hypothetical protein GE09DRAFT_359817 [Coniochaeta sp. 2T2.1]
MEAGCRRTALGKKESLQFMRRDQQDGELHQPEDTLAHYALRRNAYVVGYMVRDVEIGRPDGPDDLRHGRGPGVGLDDVSEQGGDAAGDDGEPREVPAEQGAHGHGERDVQTGADDAVQDNRDGAHQAAEDDGYDGLAPGCLCVSPRGKLSWRTDRASLCQTNSNDGGRSHPALGIESVREPVPGHGPRRPCTALNGSHIAVDVGPRPFIGEGSGLAWKNPSR